MNGDTGVRENTYFNKRSSRKGHSKEGQISLCFVGYSMPSSTLFTTQPKVQLSMLAWSFFLYKRVSQTTDFRLFQN